MDTLMRDVRYAARLLARSPGSTLAIVLTLALGIGANTAMFSVVNTVLLSPLPYAEPDRVVLMNERTKTGEPMSVSWLNFIDWREQNQVFERMGCYRFDSFNLTGTAEPERLTGRSVTASYMPTLGVEPLLGRQFHVEDDQPGAEPTVMLSEALWRRRFAADPDVAGTAVSLNGIPHTIVGVIPDSLTRLQGTDVYVPLGIRLTDAFRNRGAHPALIAVGRLRAGIGLEQAQADMDGVAARLSAQYPDSNDGSRVELTLAREQLVGGIRRPLLMLAGAVGFVLLIACANVANLAMTRATARAGELAIRSALGARRSRIARLLLTESLLLALCGGGLGLLLALWGTEALVAVAPSGVPRIEDVRLDGAVLAFTLAVSALTGLLFGLAPASHALRQDLTTSLKEAGRAAAGVTRGRLRGALVVSQVALTLILLVGCGLLARSFLGLIRVDPGFEPEGVLTVSLSVPSARYPSLEAWTDLHSQILQRLETLPDVASAAVASSIPLGGRGSESSFSVEGKVAAPGEPGYQGQYTDVSPDYFRTMGIPLLLGRSFDDRDREGAPLVAVIDEMLARKHFAGGDPIGKRIAFEGTREQPRWREIVGVVGHTLHYGLDAQSLPQIYVPYTQIAYYQRERRPDMAFFVKAAAGRGSPGALAAPVRAAIWSLDRDQPIFLVQSLGQFVSDQAAQQKFAALLFAVFSGLALVLAAVGIYGVLSFTVARRTGEIGLRMALGARRTDVIRMIGAQGLRLVGSGLAAGLVASLGLTRLMSGMLFGVRSSDPATFASVCLLLIVVAAVACWLPARRAAKVDPMTALRYE